MMLEISWLQMVLVFLCALFIGISKTGLPTLGILVVAMMASVFPARDSIGIVLPMLLTADLIAVTYYRKTVNWKLLLSMLPWVTGGLICGFFLLFSIHSSRPIEIILGLIILIMIGLQFARERWGGQWIRNIPQSKSFVIVMGTLAGFTTMVGNAAGPIMAIFMLALALPKKEFIGTGAWFYFTVNVIKIPLYTSLGLITGGTLLFYTYFIPFILLGAFIGFKCLPFIPQKYFNHAILLLAALGGLKLVWI